MKKFSSIKTVSTAVVPNGTHFFVRHPFLIPVTSFVALFLIGLAFFVSFNGQTVGATDKRIVQIFYDGKSQTVPTRAKTVGDLLERLKIPVSTKDVVEPSLDSPIVEDNFKVNVYRARPVVVIDGAKKSYVISAATSGRTAAEQAGVAVYAEDKVERDAIDNVARDGIGDRVTISRATPVKIILYGDALTLRTHVKTVGDLLKEKNVILAKDDTIQPNVSTPLLANMYRPDHGGSRSVH